MKRSLFSAFLTLLFFAGGAWAIERIATLPPYNPATDVGKVAIIGPTNVIWGNAQSASGALVGPTSSVNHDLSYFVGTNGETIGDSGIPSANVVLVSRNVFGGSGITVYPQTALTSDITIASTLVTPTGTTTNDLVSWGGPSGNTFSDSGVSKSNVVQITRNVNTGTGLSGGGALSSDLTISPSFGATSSNICIGNDARLAATTNSESNQVLNAGLFASVAANALVIALKQADGVSSPSTGNSAVSFGFRDSVSAPTGDFSIVNATAATSITVPSSATLGMANGVTGYVYVYAINNAGTVELGVSGSVLDEGTVQSSTTIGAGSTSASVLYSTTGRASKGVRLFGRIQITEATAGTWATLPLDIVTQPFVTTQAGDLSGVLPTDPNKIGYLYGPLSRLSSGTSGLTTSVAVNVAAAQSLTLTPGDYEISAMCGFQSTSASTSVTQYSCAVSKTSATFPAAATIAVPTACEVWVVNSVTASVTNSYNVVTIPSYHCTVTTNTPIYLVASAVFTVATETVFGSMEIRRLR